jgi:hypothetical protein
MKVHGCGCRYRYETECEHLCDKHKDEFILRMFNGQLAIKQLKEHGWNGL